MINVLEHNHQNSIRIQIDSRMYVVALNADVRSVSNDEVVISSNTTKPLSWFVLEPDNVYKPITDNESIFPIGYWCRKYPDSSMLWSTRVWSHRRGVIWPEKNIEPVATPEVKNNELTLTIPGDDVLFVTGIKNVMIPVNGRTIGYTSTPRRQFAWERQRFGCVVVFSYADEPRALVISDFDNQQVYQHMLVVSDITMEEEDVENE